MNIALGIWGVITFGCLVGAVGFFASAKNEDERNREVEAWRPVDAEVVDTGSTRQSDGSYYYWAKVEYVDTSGTRHELRGSSRYAYDESTYEILYDPDEPERAAWGIPGRSSKWIAAAVLAMFAIVFFVLGVKVRRAQSRSS